MNHPITIATFYSFAPLSDPKALREPLLERMRALGIKGTITLAAEGVNATISGARESLDALLAFFRAHAPLVMPTYRESEASTQPFQRSKVKVKRELISLGVPTAPAQCVGRYVKPGAWNALITQSGVIVIDTRNDYEFQLGHFSGAVNPGTRHFKQMVAWTKKNLALPSSREKKNHSAIAMYCTGGIRCEKYSSYLVSLGFTEVYHLEGGILAYLEQIPPEKSLWHGECFVFDERVSLGHGLHITTDSAAS